MADAAPGRHFRKGLSLRDVMDLFPTEASTVQGFEALQWPDGRHCRKCGGTHTREIRHPTMPDRHPAGVFQHPPSQVGHRRPFLPDQPAVGLQAVAPGPERVAEDGLVHAAPHPRGLGAAGGSEYALRRSVEVDETYMRVEFLLLAT